jgi:HlyD family secretion protein
MATSRLVPITATIVLLAAAAGGYYYYQRSRTAEQPITYITAVIGRGNVRQVVTATGQLDAVLSVDVGSQISGLIVKLHADFNTVVKKDQVLAEIDPATYKQKLRQAEADLASTKASNRLQFLNTDRTRELFAKSLVTRQELDQAEAQLAQSNAALLTREAAVENANVDLARCTIRSPIDGMVISKQTEEGKTVAASLNAPVLFTIANDLAKMQITAAVAEADVGSVESAQPVTFTVDAFPGRSFTGQVTQVRNAPKTTQNVVSYETIISVDNRDLKLRPGMTANVSIVVASRDNTLRVPNTALRVRLPDGASGATAPVKRDDAAAGPVAGAGAANAPRVATAAPTEGRGERRQGGGGGGNPGGGGGFGGGNAGGGGRGGGFLGPDATPEQRQKAREIMTELGIDFRSGPPSPEQMAQFRKALIERGVIPAPGAATVTTRTLYRLPGGNKNAPPEAVSAKIGITDGITSEVIDGLAEGDVIITGVNSTGAAGGPAAPVNNPFGGGQRRF